MDWNDRVVLTLLMKRVRALHHACISSALFSEQDALLYQDNQALKERSLGMKQAYSTAAVWLKSALDEYEQWDRNVT